MGGGKLGELTKKGSAQTFSGLLSTVESRPFELLMGLDKSKGFAALKGVLRTSPTSSTRTGRLASASRRR
jgi:hypothetical protein